MSERSRGEISRPITGVLLAAGSATRFGSQKLLHRLPGDIPIAVAAVRALLAVLPRVVAVVRPDDAAVAEPLANCGAEVLFCSECHAGIGCSIAAGIRASSEAAGWLIALADMPYIRTASVAAVADQISAGIAICVPRWQGRRGHPAGFARRYYGELIALKEDRGARSIIDNYAEDVVYLDCSDPGVVRDIDTPADLLAR